MLVQVEITKEMIAAGLEAMREAHAECLTEAEIVSEVFLAMYGYAVVLEPETLH